MRHGVLSLVLNIQDIKVWQIGLLLAICVFCFFISIWAMIEMGRIKDAIKEDMRNYNNRISSNTAKIESNTKKINDLKETKEVLKQTKQMLERQNAAINKQMSTIDTLLAKIPDNE